MDRANKYFYYADGDEALTAKEIVRLDSIWLISAKSLSIGVSYTQRYDIADGSLDTVNCRLVMTAGNITGVYGNTFFTEPNYWIGRYIHDVPMDHPRWGTVDTLGYIPNAQRREAYEKTVALWESEDWPQIYEIFQNAFTFVPCTGAELAEMEKSGTW